MRTALITGVNGQDGSYLAELLLAKNYQVFGAVRSVKHAKAMAHKSIKNKIHYVHWDMLDQQQMIGVLTQCKPTELYNFAAYSSGSGMYDDPEGIGELNGLAVTRILEAIRTAGPSIRFCQASSREIFGEAQCSPQTELTPKNPRSPYGAAKLYADNMIKVYRQRYGLFACSAILFNHESPRRGLDFVTRKITNQAVKIKLGLASELHLGNLDAKRDWGFAGDYVRAMWLMLQQEVAEDYVISTGETRSVREFCEIVFSHLNLDYREYVFEDISAYRPAEPLSLVGCAEKAKSQLKWVPEVRFTELIHMMVDSDLKELSGSII